MLCTRCSCQILIILEYSSQILEKYSYISIFLKIRTLGAKLFHAEGLTDRQT
jgi:hypothetical protein